MRESNETEDVSSVLSSDFDDDSPTPVLSLGTYSIPGGL